MTIGKTEKLASELGKLWRCEHGHSAQSHPACARKSFKIDKVAILDIESSGIQSAVYGIVYSFALLELTPEGKPGKLIYRSVSSDDIHNSRMDRDIVKDLVQRLNDYTKIITHYGNKFDLPWVYTRALRWGWDKYWPEPKTIKLVDTWILARPHTIMSRRLGSLEDLMTGKTDKTFMDGRMWEAVMAGRKDGLDWLKDHNCKDVYSTYEVYNRLKRWDSPLSRRYV